MTVTTNGQEQRINISRQTMFLYVTLFVAFSFLFMFRWLPMTSHLHLLQHQRRLRGKNVDETNSTSLLCDEECLRFGRLLDAWPGDKPKAAVVLLLQNHGMFRQWSQLFSANFNNVYNYPVIVFHEYNMNNEDDRKWLRSYSRSDLYLQVRFFLVTTYNYIHYHSLNGSSDSVNGDLQFLWG